MSRWLLHLSVLLLLISSCTGLKHIESSDRMFTGYTFEMSESNRYTKRILSRTSNKITPKSNNRFLWMRPAVARYNMLSDSARQKKFWRSKVDSATTMSMVRPGYVAEILQNRFLHFGYFENEISFDTLSLGSKRGKYKYHIQLNRPSRLGTISFPGGGDTLSSLVRQSATESLLQTGDIYSLDNLKEERLRIDRYLREQGYIYFNPDFIQFIADSVSQPYTINLRVAIKPETPEESRQQYRIGSIYLFENMFDPNDETDTISDPPFYLVTGDQKVRFPTYRRGIFFTSGELYSRTKRRQTLRYLDNLPIVRSTTTNFRRVDDSNTLDASIYVGTQKRFAYSAELNAIFRSTNYFGPGIIFSLTDRNTRKRAERLQLNLRGRFEAQIADGQFNPAYEVGIELNYLFPRLVPVFLDRIGKALVPRSQLSMGYNLFNRLDLYRLNSIFLDFGYSWRRSDIIGHTFKPIDIVFTQIPEDSKSDKFKEYLEDNPGVERSFDEQFVVGVQYEFLYDPRVGERSDFAFRGGIDLAGNLLDLGYSVFNSERDSSGRYTLFGVPFSQFGRLRLEFRYAYNLNERSSLVTRLITGLGIPYGNSSILPYIRQFYVGGPNSLRSFVARTVGPGSEVPPEGFNDLTGDIRVEFNLEYRFTIAGKFKGAVFGDAGNIWLYNFDEARPNGVFRFNRFMDEIAVSAGLGLRWDFDFVVARLDLAYTLRTPYLPEGERWRTRINLLRPTFNIAVGYPF